MHEDAISIVKTLRDCTHNVALKQKEADRGFIYDYEVFINRELRAMFCPKSYGQSRWELAWPRGSGHYQEITFKGQCWPITAGLFKYAVKKALEHNALPTVEQIEAKLRSEKRKVRLLEAQQRRAARAARISDHGNRLLEVAKYGLRVAMQIQTYPMDRDDRLDLQEFIARASNTIRSATEEPKS